jgi:hypothetical protein
MSPLKEIGRYGSVGIEFVLTILIVSWCGHWLDGRYWGGHGWGLVGGFVLGVAMGFRNLVRTAQQMQRDIERAEANDPQAGRWTVDPAWLHGEAPEAPKTDTQGDASGDRPAPDADDQGGGSSDGSKGAR